MSFGPGVLAGLEQASQALFDTHFDDPNFTGCGIGFRRRGGQVTSEPAVIAMVVNKLPHGAVSRRWLLPSSVRAAGREWGVDVVEVGQLTPASSTGGPAIEADASTAHGGPIITRMRPPLQGCSISNINAETSDTGTLGCYVWNLDNLNPGVAVLSTNHVLARLNQSTLGVGSDPIIQPAAADGGTTDDGGAADGIATVTDYISLVPGQTTQNKIDAAVANLNGGMEWSTNFAGDLMAPITDEHLAVGMVVASDFSGNCFLCRMDTVLSELNVSISQVPGAPFTIGGEDFVTAPVVGMNIEKVGRTSGYSSSTIDAIGARVKIAYTSDTVFVLSDMIWTQFFATDGDSGAVACQGGDGQTYVLPPENAPCPLSSAVEGYYSLPSATEGGTANNALTNQFQDQFLTQSMCGNLMIGMVYLNAQVVIDRLQADQGQAYNQAAAQTVMQQFYTQYADQLATMLANPDPSVVITQQNLQDLESLMTELAGTPAEGYPDGQGLLTSAEKLAAVQLFLGVAVQTNGMNYYQLIEFMNETSIYNQVFNALAAVPTIVMP